MTYPVFGFGTKRPIASSSEEEADAGGTNLGQFSPVRVLLVHKGVFMPRRAVAAVQWLLKRPLDLVNYRLKRLRGIMHCPP